MAVGHVDPADWLLDLWHFQAHPRRTGVYDLALQLVLLRPLQHVAHTRDNRYSRPAWYFSRGFLYLRPHRLLPLQSAFKFFLRILILTLLIIHFILDFLPSYLFTALSTFSWVCWIAPNNVKVNQIFGITHGLGMGLMTFDWGVITAFSESPLVYPWWVAANAGIAIVLFYWLLVPILYVSPHFLFHFFFISERTYPVFQRLVQCLPAPAIISVLRQHRKCIQCLASHQRRRLVQP